MVIVPEFLIKRIYKKGSLAKIENGASFQLKNVLGPGYISGINYVQINDVKYEPKDIKCQINNEIIEATAITEAHPIAFRLGQEGTIIMTGSESIIEGNNKIIIDVMNPEAGKVQIKVEDIC